MEYQSTIHDHTLNQFPDIFNDEELKKIEFAMLHPHRHRQGELGTFLIWRNITLLKLSKECALRTKEAVSLKKCDIDFNKRAIYISPTSNKLRKGRVIPLSEKAFIQLCGYFMQLTKQWWNFSEYLFPSIKEDRLSCDQWRDIMARAVEEAGIIRSPRKKTPYTLRHTKATEVYIKTHDIKKVADILGHSDYESSKIYLSLSKLYAEGYLEEMREALS